MLSPSFASGYGRADKIYEVILTQTLSFFILNWHSDHLSANIVKSDRRLYMAIIRWDPMTSLLHWPNVWEDDDLSPSGNLDVYETKDEVIVKANVAGVDPDKVEITFEKGILTVSAREEIEEQSDKKFYKKATRSYSYRVAVPGNIDLAQEPEATAKHGILAISFKKAEEAKPKKIAIKK
jgi:HSP20 family protein